MLLRGNCLEQLKALPDNSVDCVVTDPPYELGFMGKSWDNSGIAYNVELWGECLRVLKPGGHLLAFGGSRTYHRLASAVEDSGFEIRDQIMWLYGSGFPKSHNIGKAIDKAAGAPVKVGKRFTVAGGIEAQPTPQGEAREEMRHNAITPEAQQWQGWGTALKPSHEPVVVARKPFEGTVVNNVLTYGTGAINIDGSRVGLQDGETKVGGFGNGGIGFGGGDGKNVEWQENTQGRWPANTIITHSAGCIQKAGTSEIVGGGAKASSGFVNGYENDGFVGKEITNAVWACVEGCPVLNFPQTASTGNGTTTGFRKGGDSEHSVGLAGEKQAADGYADGGSAARYFTQTAYGEGDYAPSHDPVVVARKPLEGTVVENVLRYGTGGLNIDASRVGTSGENFDDLKGRPITKLATRREGETDEEYNARVLENPSQQEALAKLKELGRWPANTMITHSHGCQQVGVAEDSVVAGERTANFGTQETKSGGNGSGNWGGRSMTVPVWNCVEGCPTLGFPDSKGSVRKPTGNYILNQETGWNSNSMTDATVRGFDDSGSAARFFSQTAYDEPDFPDFIYQAKAGKKERNAGLGDLDERQTTGGGGLTAEVRDDGSLETASAGGKFGSVKALQQNFHPTVKPLALMRHLVRLVCPPNGVVLDPFLGSGTTAVAAVLEGFDWIGCELTEDYWPIIEARIAWAEKERNAQTPEATRPTLFGEQP